MRVPRLHQLRATDLKEEEEEEAALTNILRGAQDLPHLRDAVHAPGQAKVHDADVSQRAGTGQQDVLGLRSDRERRLDRGTLYNNGLHAPDYYTSL